MAEVFGVKVVGALMPNSTAIPTNNADPIASRNVAHARTRLNGGLSLAHAETNGLDITIWVWSNTMQCWLRITPAGSVTTVAGFTLVNFPDVPPGALVYIQSSAIPAASKNVYLGNVKTATDGEFATPALP